MDNVGVDVGVVVGVNVDKVITVDVGVLEGVGVAIGVQTGSVFVGTTGFGVSVG